MITKLTKENFTNVIQEGVTLVDFWAEWCGPCRALNPTIEELSTKYVNQAKIGKVNVDENQTLSLKYNVRSIPTIIIFKDGQPVDRLVGAATLNTLSDKINQYL